MNEIDREILYRLRNLQSQSPSSLQTSLSDAQIYERLNQLKGHTASGVSESSAPFHISQPSTADDLINKFKEECELDEKKIKSGEYIDQLIELRLKKLREFDTNENAIIAKKQKICTQREPRSESHKLISKILHEAALEKKFNLPDWRTEKPVSDDDDMNEITSSDSESKSDEDE